MDGKLDWIALARFHGANESNSDITREQAQSTWIHRVFGGKTRDRYSCTCRATRDVYTPFSELVLGITDSTTLEDALERHTREWLFEDKVVKEDGLYPCAKYVEHLVLLFQIGELTVSSYRCGHNSSANRKITVHEAL